MSSVSIREKDMSYEVLRDLRAPDRYSSNISSCIDLHHKITQLKSHDCHILMSQLLQIALQCSLSVKSVYSRFIELCNFYWELYFKEHKAEDFDKLERKIAITLCRLK